MKRWIHRMLPLAISLAAVSTAVAAPDGTPVTMQYAAAAPAADAASSGFRDTSGHWGAETIEWAVKNGLVDGYEDGTFRPDDAVSESEFLAMLLRAYPESGVKPASAGEPWHAPYYAYIQSQGWPLRSSAERSEYTRGDVARLIAGSRIGDAPVEQAVQYMLDRGWSQGKTAATVQGFAAGDPLTRAEAVQFIRNLKQSGFTLADTAGGGSSAEAGSNAGQQAGSPANPGTGQAPQDGSSAGPSAGQAPQSVSSSSSKTEVRTSVTVSGISIGDSESSVLRKLGQPARKDPGEYDFEWYIYNEDYTNYLQVGIHDGKVVALFSPSANWRDAEGIKDGSTREDVLKAYGEPLKSIVKDKTRFVQNYGNDEYGTYELDDAYVTFFYDLHRNNAVSGVQAIAKQTELERVSFYPEEKEEIAEAFERQTFDLANVFRVKLGKRPFTWDDRAAATAKGHAADMAANNYFDHKNLKGQTPFDRMEASGIRFTAAAENIAAGQPSAIFAHYSWVNSASHRKSLLSDIERLGTGVVFGGTMHVYYGQNFYTP